MWTAGRRDRQDEANITFLIFANAPLTRPFLYQLRNEAQILPIFHKPNYKFDCLLLL
jgi:hypothetical protein